MLGPMGAYVISALRVMTPAEIDRYAKSSDKKKVTALAAGAEDFDLSSSVPFGEGKKEQGTGFKPMTEAEIIPIDSYKQSSREQNSEEGQHQTDPFSRSADQAAAEGGNSEAGSAELESIGIFSAQKVNAAIKAKEQAARSKEDSATVFLLKERERLKKTNNRMAGSAAIKSYTQTASAEIIEVEPNIENPDEELAQGSRGILINKKHY